MTEGRVRKEHRIHYKLDQVTPVNTYEMNTYNVPFAGNSSTCRETFIKGERVLEFSIPADMTVDQLISKPMFRDELVEYMYSLSKQLVSIVQNGLNINKIVFDLKFLYARMSDFTVQIIYLPLDKDFPEVCVGDFIKAFLAKVVYAQTAAVECANQIVDYFNDNKAFDVFNFNKFIKELRASSQLLIIQEEVADLKAEQVAQTVKERVERTTVLYEETAKLADEIRKSQEAVAVEEKEYVCPKLIRKNTGEEISINKQVFCIGKADQGVDYKITGNKSVSRRHAYITSINGVYYLMDNNSTNHTYLNGTQVYGKMEVAIPDNSIIRISNEEFLFRIG
jgi:hypothetical protein